MSKLIFFPKPNMTFTAELDTYFSITGEVRHSSRRDDVSYGMQHDALHETNHFLKNYTQWHLYKLWIAPMHYIDNSIYWLGIGKYSEHYNLNHFKSTCVWGETPQDTEENLFKILEWAKNEEKEKIVEFLKNRLPELNQKFEKAMLELGLLELTRKV